MLALLNQSKNSPGYKCLKKSVAEHIAKADWKKAQKDSAVNCFIRTIAKVFPNHKKLPTMIFMQSLLKFVPN